MTVVEVDVVVVAAVVAVAIVADIAVTTVVVIVVVMIVENPIPDEAAMDGNIWYKNHKIEFLFRDRYDDRRGGYGQDRQQGKNPIRKIFIFIFSFQVLTETDLQQKDHQEKNQENLVMHHLVS